MRHVPVVLNTCHVCHRVLRGEYDGRAKNMSENFLPWAHLIFTLNVTEAFSYLNCLMMIGNEWRDPVWGQSDDWGRGLWCCLGSALCHWGTWMSGDPRLLCQPRQEERTTVCWLNIFWMAQARGFSLANSDDPGNLLLYRVLCTPCPCSPPCDVYFSSKIEIKSRLCPGLVFIENDFDTEHIL